CGWSSATGKSRVSSGEARISHLLPRPWAFENRFPAAAEASCRRLLPEEPRPATIRKNLRRPAPEAAGGSGRPGVSVGVAPGVHRDAGVGPVVVVPGARGAVEAELQRASVARGEPGRPRPRRPFVHRHVPHVLPRAGPFAAV